MDHTIVPDADGAWRALQGWVIVGHREAKDCFARFIRPRHFEFHPSWRPRAICLDTTVFLHAYVLTCLFATPCSPTLTHIDNHLTPCDTYLITISGRTSSTGVRHTFRFLVFAVWFSNLPLDFDSVFFYIFLALPTVPTGRQGTPRTRANRSLLAKVPWAR